MASMETATVDAAASVVTTKSPEPGFYLGVPFPGYQSWPYHNNSLLTYARQSMRHMQQAELDPPRNDTDAMRLGSLVHTAGLESLSLLERYVVLPDLAAEIRRPDGGTYANVKATKEYRERLAEFRRVNSGKEIISREEYSRMIEIIQSVSGNVVAEEMLSGDGTAEVSIVWDDDATGLRCKARIDWVRTDLFKFTDLKTTRDAGAFEKSIENFRYHRQMAFYAMGLKALTGQDWEASIVAVETERPYGVRAAPMSIADMEEGTAEARELLGKIAEARRTNEYPCYENPEAWRRPAWAWRGRSGEEAVELTIGGQKLEVK